MSSSSHSDDVPADTQINHSDSIKYWDSIPSDVNGMLGGYPHVSRVDIQGSRAFLVKCGISASKPVVRETRAKRTIGGMAKKVDDNVKPEAATKKAKEEPQEEKRLERAVDCGAGYVAMLQLRRTEVSTWMASMGKGHHVVVQRPPMHVQAEASSSRSCMMLTSVYSIGRITKDLLLSLSTIVDIVEPISKFTAELVDVPGIGDIYNAGLESWEPKAGTEYDLIWNQWCVGHLTDAQLVAYLKKCGGLLRKDDAGKVTGLVVVKENLAPVVDCFDEEDSSVTRYVLFSTRFIVVAQLGRRWSLWLWLEAHKYPGRKTSSRRSSKTPV